MKPQMAAKAPLPSRQRRSTHHRAANPMTVNELCSACSTGQSGLIQVAAKIANTMAKAAFLVGVMQ